LPLLAQHNLRTFVTSNLSPLHPYFLTGFTDAEGCFNISIFKDNTFKFGLHPQFITGFTDGEGSFMVSIFRNPKTRLGWSVKPIFQIQLHYRDEKLLREIQAYFSGVGLIRKKGTRDICSYTVSSIKELLVILKHFDKFPLISQKCADYQLFKRAVELMERKEHLTTDGLQKIVATKSAMNLGLSEQLIAAFPSIVSSERSIVKDQKISDPY
jgi:hypothetical protein